MEYKAEQDPTPDPRIEKMQSLIKKLKKHEVSKQAE